MSHLQYVHIVIEVYDDVLLTQVVTFCNSYTVKNGVYCYTLFGVVQPVFSEHPLNVPFAAKLFHLGSCTYIYIFNRHSLVPAHGVFFYYTKEIKLQRQC